MAACLDEIIGMIPEAKQSAKLRRLMAIIQTAEATDYADSKEFETDEKVRKLVNHLDLDR